jgi:hypothetical protein
MGKTVGMAMGMPPIKRTNKATAVIVPVVGIEN